MIYINSERREAILLPIDEDFVMVISYSKKTKKERIFLIPLKEYRYIEKIPNKEVVVDLLLVSKKYKKVYTYEEAKQMKRAADNLYILEIDRNDETVQNILKEKIPNLNMQDSIIKQVISNNIIKKS